MTKIDLEEHGESFCWCYDLGISIGDQSICCIERFIERCPSRELHAWNRYRSVFEQAIHLVDPQLVRYGEIGEEGLVVPAVEPPIRHSSKKSSLARESIQAFPCGARRADKEPPEQPGADERE